MSHIKVVIKIIGYEIMSCSASKPTSDFEELVLNRLNQGWELVGGPYLVSGVHHQGILLKGYGEKKEGDV